MYYISIFLVVSFISKTLMKLLSWFPYKVLWHVLMYICPCCQTSKYWYVKIIRCWAVKFKIVRYGLYSAMAYGFWVKHHSHHRQVVALFVQDVDSYTDIVFSVRYLERGWTKQYLWHGKQTNSSTLRWGRAGRYNHVLFFPFFYQN